MPRPKYSDRYTPIVPWVESNVYLSDLTPHPGKLKLFPWQKGILEEYQLPTTNRMSMMMSSQIGKSLLMLATLFYHIGTAPQNILLVQPGEELLKRFFDEKLEPALEAAPHLNARVDRTRVGTVPARHIPYVGGNIYTAISGSSASMKSISTGLVFADEVDEYKANRDTANPLSLLWQRTAAFGARAKMYDASTPRESGTSLIEQSFNSGSQGYWMVPCPHCSWCHYLDWDNVRNLRLYCPSCGAEISEADRLEIVMAGRWEHNYPDRLSHRSFHINQLYSMYKSLAKTASEYDDKNPRGFWTQVLGLPYRSLVQNAVTENEVKSLYSDTWIMPEGTLTIKDADAVTSSVDVQGNRLEVQHVLWSGRYPRVDSHVRIPMNPEYPDEAWKQVNVELSKYNPDRVFVDRHYPSPDEVKYYAEKYLSYWLMTGKMWLIVGMDSQFHSSFIRKAPTPKNPYYASLAVDTAKVWIVSLVSNKAMSINGSKVPEDFHEQLSAEELRYTVTQSGTEKQKWVPIRERNEAFDLMVYNACAHESLGNDFTRKAAMTWDELAALV